MNKVNKEFQGRLPCLIVAVMNAALRMCRTPWKNTKSIELFYRQTSCNVSGGRHSNLWEDNIKMNLRKIVFWDMNLLEVPLEEIQVTVI